MKNGRMAILREEWVAICRGDLIAALLLERILWENHSVKFAGVPRSSKSLASALFSCTSRTLRRKLSLLIRVGLIEEKEGNLHPAYDEIRKRAKEAGFMVDDSRWDPEKEWKEMVDDVDARRKEAEPEEEPEQPKLGMPESSERHAWYRQYRQLDSAPGFALTVSWMMWEIVAIEPYGSKKSWISACSQLWEATGRNESVLEEALRDGNTVRMQHGLTLSGPRSFVKFGINAKSKQALQRRPNASGGGAREGQLHGQRVEDGKIKLGRS
jgi:hypothetical protein